MRHLVITVFLLFATTVPTVLSAQTLNDIPPAPGLESAVGRSFEPAGRRDPSITFLEVRSMQFNSEASARDAIDLWFNQLAIDTDSYRFDLANLSPVGVPLVGDETRAIAGTAPLYGDSDISLEVAAVVVREENTLLAFLAWSEQSYVVDETIEVAERTLGLEPLEVQPVPGVEYHEGDTWDLLPKIEHVPEGLTWNRDFLPCLGVFGVNECPPIPSTPAATPLSNSHTSSTYQ